MRSAEVVIIGAGVIGASVAYHLAQKGCESVLVLERNREPGGGSTSRATGGFRAQFGSEINVRLAALAREALALRGGSRRVPGYLPYGYLFLAGDGEQLDALRAAQDVQRAAGLKEAREVTPSEIEEINPAIRTDGLVGGILPDRRLYPADGDPARLRRGRQTAWRAVRVRRGVCGFRAGRVGQDLDGAYLRRRRCRRGGRERRGGLGGAGGAGGWSGSPRRTAPQAGGRYVPLRSLARRNADDHLRRGRVSSSRARRARADPVARRARCSRPLRSERR